MKKRQLMSLAAALACATSTTAFAQPAQAANADSALLQAAQQRKDAFVKDLATLVNIDTGTDDANGLAKVEAILAQHLKDLGASVEIVAAPPAAGKAVIGKLQGTGTQNIMLMIHYDTVFGVGEAAKRPFKITGNKATGPGVADAKGGALMILYALEIARARGFKDYKTLTVLFNPDEEKSSLGSRSLISKLSADQDYVLVYEPPEADVVTVATNGIAYVHLDVKGRASHAGSAPEAGRNAALELSNQIVQLKDLGDPAKGTTVTAFFGAGAFTDEQPLGLFVADAENSLVSPLLQRTGRAFGDALLEFGPRHAGDLRHPCVERQTRRRRLSHDRRRRRLRARCCTNNRRLHRCVIDGRSRIAAAPLRPDLVAIGQSPIRQGACGKPGLL